ncbi:MAG: tRNA (adenosine(37)-N6)-dimethylallyltransferase MiaA [Thermoleophilia bacterium]|nr:tRNA (adenosine(37)-N6)-dimethylallyltransferase MiaA [Thermoleophilia bacterium]
MAEPLVIGIFGPTASGKSDVAEAIADRIPAELVSADSMQVYRGLPILTNQPQRPTRLVAIWPLEQEASVGAYQPLAHAAIDEILGSGRTPVVVGGTGLYLRAALTRLRLPPPPGPGVRKRWEQFYDDHGPVHAHGRLQALDPEAAAAVHPNDRRRVVRALELAEAGESLAGDRLWQEDYRHPTILFGLEVPPDELELRIEERTRAMFDAGVEEEVRAALAGPVSTTARRALGLDAVAELPREKAIAALVVRTRRYAAYQRKWLRRSPGVVSVRANRSAAEVADEILEVARARERVPRRRG